MPGTLYVVPTPIGNLDDITLRALKVLESVQIIAAEDTRHTGLMLHHYQLKKQLISYQEHNEQYRIPEIIAALKDNLDVALVSDAGTPALSDPGFKLVREAIAQELPIDVLPGASSIIVALVGSGLPTDKFYYAGFLPRTSNKRQALFSSLALLPASLVFMESPHRISASLSDAQSVFGQRPAVVARELTKLYQQYHRGLLGDLAKQFSQRQTKGELVVVINGAK